MSDYTVEALMADFRALEPAQQAIFLLELRDFLETLKPGPNDCGAPNGQHPTVPCTLPKGHEGLHRVRLGPYWQTPARPGTCTAHNDKGEPCALPRDHWCAHRNEDGYQFPTNPQVGELQSRANALERQGYPLETARLRLKAHALEQAEALSDERSGVQKNRRLV